LSGKFSVAVRLPEAVGVNVTLTEQVPFGATVVPEHVSALLLKSPGFAPIMVTVETVRLAAPLLVKVTVLAPPFVPTGSLVKLRLETLRRTFGELPVPLKLTVWGLLAALSGKLSSAVRVPAPEGVNVIPTEQVPFGVTVVPEHVSALLLKSPSLAPVIVTVEMTRLAFPAFVSVTVCAGPVVPTGSEGKVKAAGKLTSGPFPVPARAIVC